MLPLLELIRDGRARGILIDWLVDALNETAADLGRLARRRLALAHARWHSDLHASVDQRQRALSAGDDDGGAGYRAYLERHGVKSECEP